MEDQSQIWSRAAAWIRRYVWLILIAGHCLFSLGIWNTRIVFAEDTLPIGQAIANAKHLTMGPNIYVDAYTLIIAFLTPDPVQASAVMRFAISLMTALCLFLVLRAFRERLKMEAILFACLVWISSRLNAPEIQPTSFNALTFAIMLLGVSFLLNRRAVSGIAGFLIFGGLAVSLRPEWMAPYSLITLFLVCEAVVAWLWKRRKAGGHFRWIWAGTAIGLVVLFGVVRVVGLDKPRQVLKKADNYLLLGLGQCYASYYKTQHPEIALDPMTEYQWVLDQTFGHPSTMVEALENNPHEAVRYFSANTLKNLRNMPEELLSTRSGQTAPLWQRPHSIILFGTLLAGGTLAALGMLRSLRGRRAGETALADRDDLSAQWDYRLVRKAIILVLLASASSVSIILLVGSPRYWISIVPILYLGIAVCCDALLRAIRSVRFDAIFTAASFVCFCWPNFLGKGGANLEIESMQRVAPLVRPEPVICALWAEPFRVYGFRGEASSINAWDGIKKEDIQAGRVDILILDRGFRASKTWVDQQDFFESLERDPAQFGFAKLPNAPGSRRDVYYRPRPPAQ